MFLLQRLKCSNKNRVVKDYKKEDKISSFFQKKNELNIVNSEENRNKTNESMKFPNYIFSTE